MINVTRSDVPKLDEYLIYLEKIWENRWLTNDGDLLRLLEADLKKFLKIRNIVLVSNGTLAIQLALRSLEIRGDVITTPFTFAATTNSILWEGLNPVFADINMDTFNIDPNDVKKKITKDTKAILAVHVYGNPCEVKELQEIADDNDLKLIYDAAHAFGVEYNGESLLNHGEISTLSFHATKVFNTIEGGALVVQDEDIFEKLRLMRNHGIQSEEEVCLLGINAKMNEFQAAMGICNLKNFEANVLLRSDLYYQYKQNLGDLDNIKFQKVIASKYNYAYMPICFENGDIRNKVYSELKKEGIHTRKYFYPLTINYDYLKEDKYRFLKKYKLDVALDISERILCLPLYPDLDKDLVDKITDKIITLIKK